MNDKNFHKKEKDEITLSPMSKAPIPSENIKSQETTQRRQQKHPIRVVKLVYKIPTFLLAAKAV